MLSLLKRRQFWENATFFIVICHGLSGPVQLLALLLLLDPASSTTLKSFLVMLWRLFVFHFTFLHPKMFTLELRRRRRRLRLCQLLWEVNKEFNFIRRILGITIWNSYVERSSKSRGPFSTLLEIEEVELQKREASGKSNYYCRTGIM